VPATTPPLGDAEPFPRALGPQPQRAARSSGHPRPLDLTALRAGAQAFGPAATEGRLRLSGQGGGRTFRVWPGALRDELVC
jgi:hypothetical protein